LKQLLHQRKTTKARFKFPLTSEQAYVLLKSAYQTEVEYRQRKFIQDNATEKNLHKLATFLTNDDKKFGVMLSGVCGNGKTTMLYAIKSATNLLSAGSYFNEPTGIRIEDAKDIVRIATDNDQFQTLKRIACLAIEDMGREPAEVLNYGNVLSPIVDLLEYRYNEQLFTLVTTNLTPKQVREKYGNRIADRFNEMMEVIIFENQTYRR